MEQHTPIPIAIVGMSCRFPGDAHSPEKLWDLVSRGESGWTDVPEDRYNWKSFYHPSPEARGAHNSRGGHFINQDIAEFDPLFFGITAEEANSIDPQQRFQLMTAYEALENAGLPIEKMRGSNTAVYIAVVSRDYDRMMYKDPSDIPKYHLTGSGDATLCGRISYVFDFRGPCVTMDTGCSGSLVALHQACQSLRLQEADTALVGGTNLLLGPDMTIAMSMLHMVNDDGRCYSFDSRGSGYGRAEGVATIVLKRLDDALRDGDPIRAVIRNSGVNQDGKTNGILLPSSESQASLMRSVYQAVNIDPCEVAYVEAHGTGTAAGDAAELASISEVFCTRSRKQPLYVGSVKSNIGHLESAAGLASIIKTVMAMEKGFIPPVPNIINLKKGLDLENRNIKIPHRLELWPTEKTHRASINSFGFGGTNTHVILESSSEHIINAANISRDISRSRWVDSFQPANGIAISNHSFPWRIGNKRQHEEENVQVLPPEVESSDKRLDEAQIFVVTAKSKKSLLQNVKNLKDWVGTHSDKLVVRDLAHTLVVRRSMMPWRATVVASTVDGLIQALNVVGATKIASRLEVVYVFTGQGAQWFAMGRELLSTSSIFLSSIQRANDILATLGCPWSLLEELLKDESTSQVNESKVSQPATTAIQIALVELFASLNIEPNAAMGHSSGEIAAAYACGIVSQETALTIAYHRGFVSSWLREDSQIKGSMLAVGLGANEVADFISQLESGIVSIACVNSPSSTTISGDDNAIDELKDLLSAENVFSRKLKVDTAYHSHHVKLVAERYLKSLDNIVFQPPKQGVKFFSTVTGQVKVGDFDAGYWVSNLTSPVQFNDALSQLVSLSKNAPSRNHLFVEIGPHAALQGPIRQIMSHDNNTSIKYFYLPSLIRNQDAQKAVLSLFGKLFEHGSSIDLNFANCLIPDKQYKVTVIRDLPTYSWDVDRYWHESRLSQDYRFRTHPYHDLLGLRVIGSTPLEPSWRNILSVDSLPWLQEHIIDKFALFPGSGFLCMAIEALSQISRDRGTTNTNKISKYLLKNISFSKALVIPDSPGAVEVILSLRSSGTNDGNTITNWEDFRVTSRGQDGSWNEHCRGAIAFEFDLSDDKNTETVIENHFETEAAISKLERMKKNCSQQLATEPFYNELRSNGVDYGSTFATIQKLQLGSCQAVGTVAIPNVAANMPSGYLQPHLIHPATFDALMHIALPLYSRHCSLGPVMLIAIEEVTVSTNIKNAPGDELVVACDFSSHGSNSGSVDVTVFQNDSHLSTTPILTLSGEQFRGIGEGQAEDAKLDFAQNRSFETKVYGQNDQATKTAHLVKSLNFSAWTAKHIGEQCNETALFHRDAYPLKLEVQKPGLLDTLRFVVDESALEPIRSDELEIQVMAHSITPRDVAFAMGRLSSQTPMIAECAGIITSLGENANKRFKLGDRVFGWGGSSYRSRSRMNYQLARIIPDAFSFAQAASIPFAFQTAYHCLVGVASIYKGQRILIHSATSEVGLAAIIVAKRIGVEIFATIEEDNEGKRNFLVDYHGLTAAKIFSTNSNAWKKAVSRLTYGRGVDVVMNCLSGDLFSASYPCIAEFGFFIDVSTTKSNLSLNSSEKNVTFAKIDMPLFARSKPDKIELLFSKVMSILNESDIKLLPIRQISVGSITDAFRLAQSRNHIGKIILDAGSSSMVQQVQSSRSTVLLKDTATYIILGGGEPLVESICRYLSSRGAKQIVLLRGRNSDPAAEGVFQKVQQNGVTVEFLYCDYSKSNKASILKEVIENHRYTVKGILEVAGDLEENENSSLVEDVEGISTLRQANGCHRLDFFISISTLSRLTMRKARNISIEMQNTDLNYIGPFYFSAILGALAYDELATVLEYVISGQAKSDECTELVVGLDAQSVSSWDPSTLQDPFFAGVLSISDGRNSKTCAEVSLLQAKDFQDAVEIVTKLVSQRLAAFVAVEEDDIDLTIPISSIGLDSLVAIEFKNWIGRNLLAPLQTSEILDAKNIQELALLITKRSTLVSSHAVVRENEENQAYSPSSRGQHPKLGGKDFIASQQKIPKLPLPNMESSMQFYLESVRPFASEEEYERTCETVREFQHGDLGRTLHNRLAKLANDPNVDCWLEELYNSASFLSRRVQLVPFSNFFFTHKMSAFEHSQAERAAIIAERAFRYQQLLEANKLETQYLNEQPVCTHLNGWLFNAARRPAIGLDTMNKFPGNNYLVVLSRGHVFKVDLMKDGKNLTIKQLELAFMSIIDMIRDKAESWIGILTADERNSWAKVRELIKTTNEENSTCLDIIEAASFLICLDDASPEGASDRARHYHFGDGFNRWNDKSLQFPVCRNGISGIIGDHSMLDAGTVFGLNAFVTQGIMAYEREENDKAATEQPVIEIQEYKLLKNDTINTHIDRVRVDLARNTAGVEHAFFTMKDIGGSSFRALRCAPKSAFQVIAMLASKNFFGTLEPCWESASLSNFYKGRIENSQGLMPPVAEFLKSLENQDISIQDRRKLFFEAVKSHANAVTRAVRGRGFDRYLTSLRQVLEEREPVPALFKDPIYARTRPRKFMSHTHETGMLEQAYMLRDPDAVWLHYVVEDDSVKWSVCGPVGKTKRFCTLLEESANMIKSLLGMS